MKQAVFITHPEYKTTSHEHPWKNMKYNSYDVDLPRGEGLLTVKRLFAPDPSLKIESATLRATSLGIFDAFINGVRVGDFSANEYGEADEYKPEWTDYRNRVFEFEYDITSLIDENNIFVAEVSPGWWSSRISFGFYGFKPCAFAGEIEIEYEDGSSEIIASGADGEWEAAICGPVMTADIWDGEYYDATVPEPSIHPEEHSWTPATAFEYDGKIVPHEGAYLRNKAELTLHPQSAVVHCGTVENGSEYGEIKVISKKIGALCEQTSLKAGEALILDMGQNMVGRPIIFVKAERGTKISGYFAEMLNDSGDPERGNDGPKGSMYIKNYRSALARIVYIAGGGQPEYYFPTHSFFGFRYFELRADRDIEILGVLGEVIGSNIEETAEFSCSDPEVNKLYSNIVWGMRGNYFTAPTDCPQRDERLGWTGDTQIFCGAASYLANIKDFMHKWLGDARDSQQGFDGAYCDVIPRVFNTNNGNAAWGDAGLIVPYRLWLMYNDSEIIAEHYDSMQYYMHYLEQYGLEGPNTAYGDWLNYDVTDKRYIAVSYYAYDARLMEIFSRILGKENEAEYYRLLHEKIVNHWREKYISNGELIFKTQTAYLLALNFDLVPAEMRSSFIEKLRQAIVSNNYTLSTGFVGTGILNQTLAKLGLDDLCYSLLLQTDDPSWLYSVRQGATTVWERWNSYTIKTGFGNVGMNSFNHYAYGAVAEWMFSGMCGIMPDENDPGFCRFVLCPTPDMRSESDIPQGQQRITFAKAAYNSINGRIESSWHLVNGKYVYSFNIPADSKATVKLIASGDTVNINGVDFTITELGGEMHDSRIVFELDGGKYTVTL